MPVQPGERFEGRSLRLPGCGWNDLPPPPSAMWPRRALATREPISVRGKSRRGPSSWA